MKRCLAVVVLIVSSLFVSGLVLADGNYTPALVTNQVTQQGYLYNTITTSATAGGVLVNNGGGIFNWSNLPVGTTTSLTITQAPALPSVTTAQAQALQPVSVGQEIWCNNCKTGNGALGSVCVASGTAANGQWVIISTQVATTGCF